MATELFRRQHFAIRSVCQFQSDVCVVTFDSYTDDRSLDRRGFGEDFFAQHGVDAIHFITRENDWYQYDELPAAAQLARAAAAQHRRVVTYGSSMGGYASIRFGGMVGAAEALAISPQFSIDPRSARFETRWRQDSLRIDFRLERTLRAPFVPTAYVVYDPEDLDCRHVDLFRGHTQVVDLHLPFSGHPATGALGELGLLSRLALDFATGDMQPEAVRRLFREVEPNGARVQYLLSERAPDRRGRLVHASRAAALEPQEFGYAIHHATLLADMGRIADADAEFARAERLAPDHPVLLHKLSEFHELRGDYDAAIAQAERLVGMSETFRPRLENLRRQRARPFAHWVRRLRQLRRRFG